MNQVTYQSPFFPQQQRYTNPFTGQLVAPPTYQSPARGSRLGGDPRGLVRFSTLFGEQEREQAAVGQPMTESSPSGLGMMPAMSPEDEVKQKLAPQNYRISIGSNRGGISPSMEWYRSIDRLPFPQITGMGGMR